MMQDPKELIINEKESLLEALLKLDKTRKKALICVDDQNRLKGMLVDGDIRRGLINGKSTESPLREVMNPNPTFLTEQSAATEVSNLLSDKFKIIPVIDSDEKVVGYYSKKQTREDHNIRNKRLTILGMGYVGLTLGAVAADKGFNVCGYDISKELVEKLNRKEAPFYEEELDRYLDLNVGKRLKFTTNIDEARADIYIITVGTPLLTEKKLPNIDYVRQATSSIGNILEKGDLVILRSTVPIGCSRDVALPALEKASGLKAGKDFFLSFAPERTAEGVALKELSKNPQIVGSLDDRSFELTSRLFHSLTPSIIEVPSLEAAEFCKLIDNTFRDHLFSYSNQIAQLAEKLNLDLHELIQAVNYGYSRNKVPIPSPGVGGPCLSKDPYILGSVFDHFKIDSSLIRNARHVNELGPKLVKEKLYSLLKNAGKDPLTAQISLVGMAFKGHPETSDLRDSTSVWFLNELESLKNVKAYDAVIDDEDLESLGIEATDLEGAFKDSDAVVILNNHKSYVKWDLSHLFSLMNKPAVFIDTLHNFNPILLKQEKGILYGGLGNA